jgi:hypothetical protein
MSDEIEARLDAGSKEAALKKALRNFPDDAIGLKVVGTTERVLFEGDEPTTTYLISYIRE